MKRIFILLFGLLVLSALNTQAQQIRILFDASKAQTAGNGDWVIDADQDNIAYSTQAGTLGQPYITTKSDKSNAQQVPTPAQNLVIAGTPETYWSGGLSYWGIDCVNKGFYVETLPALTNNKPTIITYGDNTNPQDLSKYNVFIVDEPNLRFTNAEANAVINFVKNGGGLYLISDHTGANRTFSGYDAVTSWNALMDSNTVQKNPFGIHIDSVNTSGTWTNKLNTTPDSDSILNGRMGSVAQVKWDQGATISINKTANPTVNGVFFNSSNTAATSGILCAYCRYGKGKVVAMGDSSPFEDGTTTNPNVTIYNGYTSDAAQNHRKLIMNATIWLASKAGSLPVEFINFSASLNNQNNALLNWSVNQSSSDIAGFDIQFSGDGVTFSSCGKESLLNEQGAVNYYFTDNKVPTYQSNGAIYYRIAAINKDGSEKYSNVVSLHPTKKTEIVVYPNPTKNKLMIHVDPFTQPAKLIVVSTDGRMMYQQNMNECSGSIIIPVNNFTNGNYFLRLEKADGTVATAAFIKD